MKNSFIFRAFSGALSSFRIYKPASSLIRHCEGAFRRLLQEDPFCMKFKFRQKEVRQSSQSAFSLIEMLMALLVASLLLAALAPVMTRRMDDSISVKTSAGEPVKQKYEIEYGMEECSDTKTDSDGSEYCEGEFEIPRRIIGGQIQVTVIGAGGGGGVAKAAGYTEYTNTLTPNSFKVPAMTNEIETTLIAGGDGGAAGSPAQTTETFVISGTPSGVNGKLTTTYGEGVWKPSTAANNAYAIISACGGGGGGVVGSIYFPHLSYFGNAGHGAYFANKTFKLPANASSGINYAIGGGGGSWWCNSANNGLWDCNEAGVDPVSNGGAKGDYNNGGCYATQSGGQGAGQWGNYNCCTPYGTVAVPCIAAGGIAPSGSGAGSGGRGGKPTLEFPNSASASSGGSSGSISGYGGMGGTNGHSALPGGGGGGSTWLGGTLGTSKMIFQVGGGGGGTGPASYYNYGGSFNYGRFCAGGGGGGGGGMPGYTGGNGAGAAIDGAAINATSGGGATASPIFGTNYCLAGKSGTGAVSNISLNETAGRNGAMRITYFDYGNGGIGGSGGKILLNNKVSVNSGETLNIAIGGKGTGGIASYIDSSGAIVSQINPTSGGASNILRNSLVIASSNNGSISKTGSANNGKIGGDGGTTTTPFTGTCIAAKGSAAADITGTNATGYGCGGGGGYGLANGGNGSSGYARISWNKYWDSVSKTYKLSETAVGAGGGGASGNIMTYSIYAREGEKIKLRIGKGGAGGYVSNNEVIEAKKGGDTIFAYGSSRQIKAGGGGGGNSPALNGTGAGISNICHYQSTSYLNNAEYCTKGLSGSNAAKKNGGRGADLPEYGTGGNVRSPGSGTTDGYNAEGYGAGGGGASMRDIGVVNNGETVSNPTRGGDGSNGKIIIEWWE